MVDFGEINSILGIRVRRDKQKGILFLDQAKYTTEVLRRFAMETCNGVETPLNTSSKLSKSSTNEGDVDFPYRAAIGSVMYLMLMTRPDLGAAIQILSRFMESPDHTHWEAMKRVFRYISHTKDLGLKFQKIDNFELTGFCDSDWGGCVDTRRSTSGYVFMLGGAAVSWSSKRQATVAMSSCEAEYLAASHAAKESVWAMGLLREFGFNESKPVRIFSDSQSAIKLVKNSVFHSRTKHIDIHTHFIRELVENRSIEMIYISTDFQVADSLTKGLPKSKTIFCREKMGVLSF